MLADAKTSVTVPTPPSDCIETGNAFLDEVLGGGLPSGSLLVVSTAPGAGGTEFCHAVLRGAARQGRPARFASALRNAARLAEERALLFPGEDDVTAETLEPGAFLADEPAFGPRKGEALAIESAAALARFDRRRPLSDIAQGLAERAAERRAAVLLLHAPGTLSEHAETGLFELADGVLNFGWRDGGPIRRRVLWLPKLRGLPPILESEEVPVFDLSIHRGTGFGISRVKNVL